MELQFTFAERAHEEARSSAILVQCGSSEGLDDAASQTFDIVLKSGRLDEAVAKQISKKLFGGR